MIKWNKIDVPGILFPRRCPVCHEVVEDAGELACDICRTRLVHVRNPFCQKCGKPLNAEDQEYCADCRRKKHFYDKGRAAFVYEEWMRGSIAKYKYSGRREYAEFYAEEILLACAREIRSWKADVLIPIPLHASRRRKRGYNQAELLAAKLSLKSGIPMDTGYLKRTKKTRAQKELSDRDRLENLKNAFSVQKKKSFYKRIILVDDIYTTGSTMDEAARILKENGAEFIYFLCISVGRGS